MEAYLYIYYISYKQGVNNLQIAKIVPLGQAGGYLKCFTSLVHNAESRAKNWAKKNNITLI